MCLHASGGSSCSPGGKRVRADEAGEVCGGDWVTVVLTGVLLTKKLEHPQFQAAYGESKAYSRSTGTELDWDANGPGGCTQDGEPGGLPMFLLVPGWLVTNTD